MTLITEPTGDFQGNTHASASTAADAAIFARYEITFKKLPPSGEVLAIGVKVLGKTAEQLVHYYDLPECHDDNADILMPLISYAGLWVSKFVLCNTQDGGFQWMPNTRILENRAGLKPFGLTIGCLLDCSGERDHPYYRLLWEDEIRRAPGGRILPFTIGNKVKAQPAPRFVGIKPESSGESRQSSFDHQPPTSPAQQQGFGFSPSAPRWVDPEMSR